MKVEFNESFLRDIKAIKDRSALTKVKAAIENVEKADTLDKISNFRKIRGSREYFRIRAGDFRLGVKLDLDTVLFIRCLNRKDIYRYFP